MDAAGRGKKTPIREHGREASSQLRVVRLRTCALARGRWAKATGCEPPTQLVRHLGPPTLPKLTEKDGLCHGQ